VWASPWRRARERGEAAIEVLRMNRWAWAEVSAGAIVHNVRVVASRSAPSRLWAVVKANGYGHGAVLAARAALKGGAEGLCVALVQEGVELRKSGLTCPILLLSEQPAEAIGQAVRHGLTLTIYSRAALAALEATGAARHPVHLKIDTGMRRVGAAPEDAVDLATAIAGSPAACLAGVFTHLAVADDPGHPFTHRQLACFDAVLAALRAAGHRLPLVHAANSAGALAHPASRYDLVRAGITIYGLSPGIGVQRYCGDLLPALTLRARVSHVKRVAAGDGVSYGLRHTVPRDTTVATLPIGYADGVPRRLYAAGGRVLVNGRHCPIAGVVTMDQLMIACGDEPVGVGDEAVLLGRQGDGLVPVSEWAEALGTIDYEITCGISARVERREA
jgi:alanine racemase